MYGETEKENGKATEKRERCTQQAGDHENDSDGSQTTYEGCTREWIVCVGLS